MRVALGVAAVAAGLEEHNKEVNEGEECADEEKHARRRGGGGQVGCEALQGATAAVARAGLKEGDVDVRTRVRTDA